MNGLLWLGLRNHRSSVLLFSADGNSCQSSPISKEGVRGPHLSVGRVSQSLLLRAACRVRDLLMAIFGRCDLFNLLRCKAVPVIPLWKDL